MELSKLQVVLTRVVNLMIGLSNERCLKYRRLLLAKKLAQSNITEIREGVEEKGKSGCKADKKQCRTRPNSEENGGDSKIEYLLLSPFLTTTGRARRTKNQGACDVSKAHLPSG